MLLSITTTHKPATDLGFLLHKHPARCQKTKMPFGDAYVFYPTATEEVCTAALLLEIDPVGLVRNSRGHSTSIPLEQYVNDRPYVCSSLLSVAIARIYGNALNGKCKQMPDLVKKKQHLNCRLSVLPCHGGESFLKRLFEPLGYSVTAQRYPLDSNYPEWGDSQYFSVELSQETTLQELLTHLYVLVPVLDNQKHYFVDRNEIEKLILRGEGWLPTHPEKEAIALRYLKYQKSFIREALQRLLEVNPLDEEVENTSENVEAGNGETELRLND
ncbi:MAG: 3' terminal RNA ribose 2'-O-methyltransferase Hen1, partial [Candidatus Riflebacteria bacterium]|nr:3' terminal RNA ribose 2'-O-methyltransferase Hen1 [Candidatus Riflebacteria bacterium]